MARKGSLMAWCPKTPTGKVLCLMFITCLLYTSDAADE